MSVIKPYEFLALIFISSSRDTEITVVVYSDDETLNM
jgi:hypothetical protein